MIIVKVKNGKIDRALKEFKLKCRNTKLVDELRERQQFTKPSEKRRKQKLKAKYKSKNQQDD